MTERTDERGPGGREESPEGDDEVRRVVLLLFVLSEEDRLAVFSHFCRECGSDDPDCYCTRDD